MKDKSAVLLILYRGYCREKCVTSKRALMNNSPIAHSNTPVCSLSCYLSFFHYYIHFGWKLRTSNRFLPDTCSSLPIELVDFAFEGIFPSSLKATKALKVQKGSLPWHLFRLFIYLVFQQPASLPKSCLSSTSTDWRICVSCCSCLPMLSLSSCSDLSG